MSASLRKLQALLEFTDTDLNANRRGRLSKAQIEDLQANSTNELKALLIIPVVIVLWMVMYVDFKIALPAIIIIGLIGAGIVGLHRDHLKTYSDRKVRKLTGQLRKNPQSSQYGLAQYIISIDDEQLPVERHLFEALPEGKFAIYLLDKEQQILCMEPLHSSSASKPASTTRQSTARSTTKRASISKSSTSKRRIPQASKKSALASKSTSRTTPKTSKTKKPLTTSAKKSASSTTRKSAPMRRPSSATSKKPATASTNRSSSRPPHRPANNTASTTRVVAKQAKPKGVARPMQWTRTRETSESH